MFSMPSLNQCLKYSPRILPGLYRPDSRWKPVSKTILTHRDALKCGNCIGLLSEFQCNQAHAHVLNGCHVATVVITKLQQCASGSRVGQKKVRPIYPSFDRCHKFAKHRMPPKIRVSLTGNLFGGLSRFSCLDCNLHSFLVEPYPRIRGPRLGRRICFSPFNPIFSPPFQPRPGAKLSRKLPAAPK